MTVDQGVTVMSGNNGSAYLDVQGHLEAVGTEAQPIIFTSQTDNGLEQWPGITFDGGTGTLRHVTVRYAGRGCYGCQGYQSGAIAAFGVQSGQVTIEDSQVIGAASGSNSDHGLYVIDSRVAVTNTLFSGIGDDPAQAESAIYATGNSTLSLTSSAVERNTGSGLVVYGAARVQIADPAQFKFHAAPVTDGLAVLLKHVHQARADRSQPEECDLHPHHHLPVILFAFRRLRLPSAQPECSSYTSRCGRGGQGPPRPDYVRNPMLCPSWHS